jgi:hypothetical protein
MFDNTIRAIFIGVNKLLNEKGLIANPVSQFLTSPEGKGIIGRPFLRGQGFSHMRVPGMYHLI